MARDGIIGVQHATNGGSEPFLTSDNAAWIRKALEASKQKLQKDYINNLRGGQDANNNSQTVDGGDNSKGKKKSLQLGSPTIHLPTD